MSTIKQIIETMPPETQKKMYQELKDKFEQKTAPGEIPQSIKDFVKAKNEAKKQIK